MENRLGSLSPALPGQMVVFNNVMSIYFLVFSLFFFQRTVSAVINLPSYKTYFFDVVCNTSLSCDGSCAWAAEGFLDYATCPWLLALINERTFWPVRCNSKGALMCTSHFPAITSWLHYHSKHYLWTKKSLPYVAYCTTRRGKSGFGSVVSVITIWLYSTSGVLKDFILACPARRTSIEPNKQCICRTGILVHMLCYSLYISVIVCIFQLYISIFFNNPMPCEVTVICCITVWLLLCWGSWKLWSFDTFVLRTSDVKFDKNLSSGTRFKE